MSDGASPDKPGPIRTDPIAGDVLHVYDGIEEADNALPRWWLLTFYGTIAFSVVYWFGYHEYKLMPLPGEEYTAALEASSGGGAAVSEELLVALSNDPAAVDAGRALYQTNCVVCHEARGEGKIGANLTDSAWIHGGSPQNIYETIRAGVLTKGMPAWEGPLGARGVQRVTAFVLTLRDTNVPGKAPEGPPAEASPSAAAGATPSPGAPIAPHGP